MKRRNYLSVEENVRLAVGKTAWDKSKAERRDGVLLGALDALTRAALQDVVMETQASLNNAILMITHDVDKAVLLADRIVMMTNGPAARIGEDQAFAMARPQQAAPFCAGLPHIPLATTGKARQSPAQMGIKRIAGQ
jgi:nitrate/nitrite transport system ATP-binding protein